ncbi:hypothetical protein [Nostoc sp. WHI]|uniref:hypothetical protein n=1 Tax=Nostoc sp. WHI TaxID=2650611 RepID=UPI0018C6531D|nr:hypothetical protein [Nostoc sp. WHI]MBG1267759.1 hypothetical protein [Nostoc sp. WHI]
MKTLDTEAVTNHSSAYLKSLRDKYGQDFEGLSDRERLHLISQMADGLKMKFPGRTRDEIFEVGSYLTRNTTLSDRVALIELLIGQIRETSCVNDKTTNLLATNEPNQKGLGEKSS